MEEQHKVRPATNKEHEVYCDCADRYPIHIEYVCSCGFMRCEAGMKDHLFKLHFVDEGIR